MDRCRADLLALVVQVPPGVLVEHHESGIGSVGRPHRCRWHPKRVVWIGEDITGIWPDKLELHLPAADNGDHQRGPEEECEAIPVRRLGARLAFLHQSRECKLGLFAGAVEQAPDPEVIAHGYGLSDISGRVQGHRHEAAHPLAHRGVHVRLGNPLDHGFLEVLLQDAQTLECGHLPAVRLRVLGPVLKGALRGEERPGHSGYYP